jgi:ATP-binding cassette subfamily F protein 3
MSLLSVQNLNKSFAGEELLVDISFKLEPRQKLGLIGRNGSGKTTLLRILTGQVEPDKGSIILGPGVRTGYLRQEDNVDPSHTVLEEAEAAFAQVAAIEAALRLGEQRLASANAETMSEAMAEYAWLHDRFESMGGYENLRDIPSVLKQLGFSSGDLAKTCGSLSGGEKTRLAIARLLLSGPDILLLDEPTNHLDIEATEWLESFLQEYGGAIVLVSHDRYFLDRVITSVAEIEHRQLMLYTGNYSSFATQKEANRVRQLELHEREMADIAKFTEFFEKWRATPTKRAQAMQRLKWAEKLKANLTDKPLGPSKSATLSIKSEQRGGEDVVSLSGLTKAYGDRTLFRDVNLHVRRGERIGVVGPNGAGKSTLIKVLLGREQATSGVSRLGVNLSVGYFAQDTSDLDLDATVLENIMDVTEMTSEAARTHLGKFLFTGEDVFREVRKLSGGEKNKLVLAQLTLLKPNLLILDEPTNHLDIESRESLIKMLKEYGGTLILISHDRYLLDQVATRIVDVAGGTVTAYDGTYSEYREKRITILSTVRTNGASSSKGRKGPEPPTPIFNAHQLSKERRRAQAALESAETTVSELEAQLATIEHKLSSPGRNDDLVTLATQHTETGNLLEEAVSAWEQAAEYVESL